MLCKYRHEMICTLLFCWLEIGLDIAHRSLNFILFGKNKTRFALARLP